jgi:hypothetical protein
MRDAKVQAEVDELTNGLFAESSIDYLGFWEIVAIVRRKFSFFSEKEQREIVIYVVKGLITLGLVPFNFKQNPDGSYSTVIWPARGPEFAGARIRKEWNALRRDPTPAEICWFK